MCIIGVASIQSILSNIIINTITSIPPITTLYCSKYSTIFSVMSVLTTETVLGSCSRGRISRLISSLRILYSLLAILFRISLFLISSFLADVSLDSSPLIEVVVRLFSGIGYCVEILFICISSSLFSKLYVMFSFANILLVAGSSN